MCLGNSPDPGTFSSLPGIKSVLPGEFLLIYPKTFGGPPGVLQRGVFTCFTPILCQVFMDMCHHYGIKWRHEFYHTKCGVVNFGESKALHFQSMNEREWKLGNDIVDEVYEYKNLKVLKTMLGFLALSFGSRHVCLHCCSEVNCLRCP